MKKLLALVMTLVMLLSFGASSASAEGVSLTAFCMDAAYAAALEELADDYAEEHPGFELEVTTVTGVAEYYAAISAKIASGEVPDIWQYQWSTQIQAYAKAGYLLPLSDLGIEEKIATIYRPVHVYNGETYAYPMVQTFWGLFWNEKLAAQYGVTELPRDMDEWVAAMETMRQNGLEYPYLVAGKDGSGATAFIFSYLHETVSGVNPDFYYQTLTGEKSWKSEEIVNMLNQYARVLEYAPEDTLGMDIEEMKRRFAREEAVCFINGSGMIQSLRDMNPDMDFIIAATPCVLNEEDYMTVSDYDSSLSISATTEHPEEAKEFYKYLYSKHGGEVVARNTASITVVRESEVEYDSAILNQFDFLEKGNFKGYSEREWIPGIKEIMKQNVQDWMSGAFTLEQALENWDNEHQRLIKADPNFMAEFEEYRQACKSRE